MRSRDLPIRFPCPVPNQPLAAQSGRLYCASCDRNVIELDRLNAAEVRALRKRARAGERICVRYRVNEDGLIQLRPTPRLLRAAAAAAGLAAVLACGAAEADVSVPPATKSRTAAAAVDPSRARQTTNGSAQPARAKAAPLPPPVKAAPQKTKIEVTYDGGI